MDAAFSQQFKSEFGYDPDANTGTMYGAMDLFVQAVKRAGTADSTKVRDTIMNFGEFKSPVGRFTFHGNGEPEVSLIVRTMKGGKIVPFMP